MDPVVLGTHHNIHMTNDAFGSTKPKLGTVFTENQLQLPVGLRLAILHDFINWAILKFEIRTAFNLLHVLCATFFAGNGQPFISVTFEQIVGLYFVEIE